MKFLVILAGCVCERWAAAHAVEATSRSANPAAVNSPESALVLWYRQAAAEWVEALPVGNGRLGAMVFGGTAGIAEMLLQGHDGELTLLAALPKDWGTGHFKGLRGRSGFEVNVSWKDGKVEYAEIKSLLGKPCRVRFGETAKEFKTRAGEVFTLGGKKLD